MEPEHDRSKGRHELTTRGRSLLACGVVIVGAGVVLGYRDFTRIGVLLVVLPLLALLASRTRTPALQVTRTAVPQQLQAGDPAQVVVDFMNVGRRATQLYVAEETVDPRLAVRPRFVLPRMSSRATRRLSYDVHPQHRGRHQLGPVQLLHEDAFGMTRTAVELPSVTEVLVLPHVDRLGAGSPPGTGVGTEGETPQMVALHGEDDVSIRSYNDGDDLRKVHWPATAHRGELMVRQEDRPQRRSFVLLLDSRSEVHRGELRTSSFEWAVSTVASIATHLDRLGYTLYLASRETVLDQRVQLPMTLDEIIRALALAELGDETEHERVVSTAHGLTEHAGGVTAVMAAYDDHTLVELAGLRRPGTAALALVVDAAALAGGDRRPGPVAVHACELLGAAGWRTQAVAADVRPAQAWSALTSRGELRVGAS